MKWSTIRYFVHNVLMHCAYFLFLLYTLKTRQTKANAMPPLLNSMTITDTGTRTVDVSMSGVPSRGERPMKFVNCVQFAQFILPISKLAWPYVIFISFVWEFQSTAIFSNKCYINQSHPLIQSCDGWGIETAICLRVSCEGGSINVWSSVLENSQLRYFSNSLLIKADWTLYINL